MKHFNVNLREICNGWVVSSWEAEESVDVHFESFKEAKKYVKEMVREWSEETYDETDSE